MIKIKQKSLGLWTLAGIIALVLALPLLGVQAQTTNMGVGDTAVLNQSAPQTKTNVVYFYSETCAHCQDIKPFLIEIEKKYANTINFKRYEVVQSQEARDVYAEFIKAYNVPSDRTGTPSIFIGDTNLVGENEIPDRLESIINFCNDHACPLKNDLDEVVGGLKQRPPQVGGLTLTLPVVLGTAVIDSINPCAISVLIILIGFLLAVHGSRKKILGLGAVYIFAVYLAYFLAGLGIIKFIGHFNLAKVINIIAGLILLIAGIFSFKEVFQPGSTFLRIPDRTKKLLTHWLTKATMPAIFIAGVIVAGVELPCTGEVYLGILSLLSTATNKVQGYMYLLIYNFIFVSPLIIILLLAVLGVKTERLEQAFKSKSKWMRISAGILMVVLGIYLLYTVLR